MKPRQNRLIASMIAICLATVSQLAWAQQDHSGHDQDDASGQGQVMRQDGGSPDGGDQGHDGPMNREGDGGGMMNRNGDDEGMGGGMGDGMDHGMMMQRMEQMHTNMHQGTSNAGQSAFDLIKDVVNQLEANPDTDWEQVDISALRQHLIDMNQVTLYASVDAAEVEGGARYVITGDGITGDAIQRLVPTHAVAVQGEIGWNTEVETRRGGVTLTVTADDPATAARIRGLGFMGFMVQGEHHSDHHLMMAGGQAADHGNSNHDPGEAMSHEDHEPGSAHSGH